MEERFKTKLVRTRIPKTCICPHCKKEQPFKKHKEYWKRVRHLSLDKPLILLVQRINAKCLNPDCKVTNFVLPTPGIERYQRSTQGVVQEALERNVLDNVSYIRTASSLDRSFNTTGSKSTIERWKQKEASRYTFRDIIHKLNFSGFLSLDEYKPKRAKRYDLIAADAKKVRILYLENAPLSPSRAGSMGRGNIESFCWRLNALGIKPKVVIFDLLKAFPKQVKKVWPNAKLQFDHYHVIQLIHKHLKNALLYYRRSLKGKEWQFYREELWEHKWRILKNMNKWTSKDHQIIPALIQIYSGTPVENILIFKEQLYQIFDLSENEREAYFKRDNLFKETWWRSSWHLTQIMRFLMSPDFAYMVTYLSDKEIPRSGNLETLIRTWRLFEKVRYGFKTEKARQDHLKLYQIKHYLKNKIA